MAHTQTIFTYHALADELGFNATTVTPARFAEQMDALADAGYISERLDGIAPSSHETAITVTFDDGYTSVIDVALPVIRQHSGRATVFVPTAYVGRRATWDVGAIRKRLHMDWSALRELHTAGWEIGSHGVSHRALTDMPEDEAYHELIVSRNEIEQKIGAPVTSVSYPFGAFTPRIARITQEAGYRRAVTMQPGSVTTASFRLRTPRWPVYRFDRADNLLARISGPEWIQRLESTKVRMIQSFARGSRVRMMGMMNRSSPRQIEVSHVE